jgi:thioester reductase-like protein
VRSFAPGGLDVRALAGWLECLREQPGAGSPRYAWASAGGAYPIDFYLQVHNPVPGLSAGVYRYDPRRHDLTLLTTEPVLTPAHHWSENRRIHADAAFALLLVADLAAITPLYGDLAERFCYLEAGGIGQLLASRGDQVGVCPIGFVDFAAAAPTLGLGPSHRLVYTLLGGAPAPAGPPDTADAPATAGTAGSASAGGAGAGSGRERRVPVALPTDELLGATRLRLPVLPRRNRAEPVRSVLLTGGTGYLGRQLVVELLARTGVTVHALATADDDAAARDRVLAAVAEAGLALPPGSADRLVGVAGDLARPRLGLSVGAYERLAEEVGAVYHSAAKVRWLRPYEDLAEVNVTGTRRILELAADGPPKRLVHVSTLAVFPFGGSEPVTEDGPLDHGGLLYGGYPQSKWVAEKLVAAAAAQGLDTVVLRPGSVTGASRSGVFNPRSFVELLLSTVVGLGWAPLPSGGGDVPVDLVPVDYAAAASVALTLSPAGAARGDGAYHLTNPAPLPLSALYDTLEELGYRVRREPFEAWRDRLLDPAVIARTPLEPFADFLAAALEDFLRLPPYSCQRAQRDLAGTGVECAPVDAALLRTYFTALHRHGLVPTAPRPEREVDR